MKLIRIFTDDEIEAAIKYAKNGVFDYLAIMDLFLNPNVEVKSNPIFQKKFKKFYQLNVARKSDAFLLDFFSFLQNNKCSAPEYITTLKHFYKFGKVEFSFVSKLLATIDPELPIMDSNVRSVLGFNYPTGKNKIEEAGVIYRELEEWYKKFIPSKEGVKWLKLFDKEYPCSKTKITSIKKIDFILWQLGAEINKEKKSKNGKANP